MLSHQDAKDRRLNTLPPDASKMLELINHSHLPDVRPLLQNILMNTCMSK